MLFLNSDVLQKMIKQNGSTYPIVVKGLINANRGANAHWNATVNTITTQVMRSYMDLNRDAFEKISSNSSSEESRKKEQEVKLAMKWTALE